MENVEDHIGLASYVARLYLPENSIVEDSEEYAEALIGIWLASKTFDPEAGVEFAGYAQTRARWRINNMLRNRKRQFHNRMWTSTGSQTANMETDHAGPEELAEYSDWLETRREHVEAVLPDLTEPQRTAIHGVLQGKLFREIADDLGVSKQAVNKAYRRGVRELINILGEEA